MYVTSMRCGLWDVLNAVEAIQDSLEGPELLPFRGAVAGRVGGKARAT